MYLYICKKGVQYGWIFPFSISFHIIPFFFQHTVILLLQQQHTRHIHREETKHSYYYNKICEDISEEYVLKFTTRVYFICFIFSEMCVVVDDVIFVAVYMFSQVYVHLHTHTRTKKKENFSYIHTTFVMYVNVYISQKNKCSTTKDMPLPSTPTTLHSHN